MDIFFHALSVLFNIAVTFILSYHCNLVDSYYSISIVINALKWRAPCKSAQAEGLPSVIQ